MVVFWGGFFHDFFYFVLQQTANETKQLEAESKKSSQGQAVGSSGVNLVVAGQKEGYNHSQNGSNENLIINLASKRSSSAPSSGDNNPNKSQVNHTQIKTHNFDSQATMESSFGILSSADKEGSVVSEHDKQEESELPKTGTIVGLRNMFEKNNSSGESKSPLSQASSYNRGLPSRNGPKVTHESIPPQQLFSSQSDNHIGAGQMKISVNITSTTAQPQNVSSSSSRAFPFEGFSGSRGKPKKGGTWYQQVTQMACNTSQANTAMLRSSSASSSAAAAASQRAREEEKQQSFPSRSPRIITKQPAGPVQANKTTTTGKFCIKRLFQSNSLTNAVFLICLAPLNF